MKWRKISGVIVADFGQLQDKIMLKGISVLASAINSAKKDRNGYGWASSGDLLITVSLDESGKRLLQAELFVRRDEYRDQELFKEAQG